MLRLELYNILVQSNISIYTRVCKARNGFSQVCAQKKDNRVTVETFSETFFGGLSFNIKTSFLWLVIYGSVLIIARNQSDLPFDHISHVFFYVCYLLGKMLKIKYKFWENLSCLI